MKTQKLQRKTLKPQVKLKTQEKTHNSRNNSNFRHTHYVGPEEKMTKK